MNCTSNQAGHAGGRPSGYWIGLIELAWGANWTATGIECRRPDHREILFVNHLQHRPGLLRGDCQDRLRWLADVRHGLHQHSHRRTLMMLLIHVYVVDDELLLVAERLCRSHTRSTPISCCRISFMDTRTASCIQ
jgi:hypothetical protein